MCSVLHYVDFPCVFLLCAFIYFLFLTLIHISDKVLLSGICCHKSKSMSHIQKNEELKNLLGRTLSNAQRELLEKELSFYLFKLSRAPLSGHQTPLRINKVQIENMIALVERALIRKKSANVHKYVRKQWANSLHEINQMEKQQMGMREKLRVNAQNSFTE